MPLREGGYVPLEGCSESERLVSEQQCQAHWYRHVGQFVVEKSVLDAGAGTGYGLAILRLAGVAKALGFDLIRIGSEVTKGNIVDYGDSSFDVVLAIDVIEHVLDDVEFLGHLLRVSKEFVFLSTPNWNVYHAQNQYHVREYMPSELRDLIASFGFTRPTIDHYIWASNSSSGIISCPGFDPDETSENYAIMLNKGLVGYGLES